MENVKKISWILLFLGINTCLFSQMKISGIVTDKNNDPLIGVNIRIKGTSTGTITDVDGKYSIQAPDSKSVLVFSYIGFTPVEKVAGTNSTINVAMTEDTKSIDEVVVVAYGTQQKSHLTGAVASLKNDKLDEVAYSRVDQVLQGKLAGVNVNNSDPIAGAAPVIRIRGLSSISASSAPLVVVDGFPIDGGLESVSIGDVESIDVQKDAASSALYGSRAAGGVIIVTTKSGNIKQPKYAFKMYAGVKKALKLPKMLTTDQYTKLLYDEAALRMQDPAVDGTNMTYNKISETERAQWLLLHNYDDGPTNWIDEGLRPNGSIQNYQLSVSGGDKNLKYYLSGNYNGEKGIMKYSSYDKYTFRAKMDVNLSKRVTAGINIAPTITKQLTPGNDYVDFMRFPSWFPVRHNEATAALTGKTVGSYAVPTDFNGLSFNGIGYNGDAWNFSGISLWNSANNNPVNVNELTNITTDNYKVQSNAYLTYNITPDLQFKTSDGLFFEYREYNKKEQTSASKPGNPNALNRILYFHTELLTENTLNYTKKFKGHEIGALAGLTVQKSDFRTNQIYGTTFPDEQILSFNYAGNILGPLSSPGTTSDYNGDALVSGIGRITYSYLGRYLASASMRADGSSKFAAGHKWGYFPGGSLGWRVSEESFMKKIEWLSNLKPRFSYGETGNNKIRPYSYMNALYVNSYPLGTDAAQGMAATDSFIGNPDIRWEHTMEENYGLDLGFFNNRIAITIDYYNSITKALLLKQPAMLITGHSTQWNNIGKVRNRGLEIELNTTNITSRRFSWKTSINFATNKNKLIYYGGQESEMRTGARGETYIAIVGQPSIQFYGYKSSGVYTTFEEVEAAKTDPATGKAIVYSNFAPIIGGLKVLPRRNDAGDLVLDSYCRTTLGSPFPDFTWGMSNNLTYRDFDLSISMQGSQGGKLVNANIYYQEQARFNTAYTNNRYISPMFPGDGKTVYYNVTSGTLLCQTDYAIEDASYAVIRDVSLGYTIPTKLIRKIGLNSLRAFCSVQNLIYLMGSNYRGVNPEARKLANWNSVDYSDPLISGFQSGAFPLARTFTVGFDLQF